jgi:ankyrin repeat protein
MQYLFVSHWIKSAENTVGGIKKFWRHKDLPHYTQTVKPHAETHLIEAAIEGNLAFLEVYTKFKGDLTIQDQQGKSALIHAILNNRKSFVKMICEFSNLFQEEPKTFANLMEITDRHGNTPLFTAIKVNSVDCLKILISYKVNFFHRKRNGNTCLHECAAHNSVDCLIVLASYCGQELFSIINKEGDRAIDIAHRSKHL